MPKTKLKNGPRGNIRIPKPLMDEVDQAVQDFRMYGNRQQLIESAIREKIEKIKTLMKNNATQNT